MAVTLICSQHYVWKVGLFVSITVSKFLTLSFTWYRLGISCLVHSIHMSFRFRLWLKCAFLLSVVVPTGCEYRLFIGLCLFCLNLKSKFFSHRNHCIGKIDAGFPSENIYAIRINIFEGKPAPTMLIYSARIRIKQLSVQSSRNSVQNVFLKLLQRLPHGWVEIQLAFFGVN